MVVCQIRKCGAFVSVRFSPDVTLRAQTPEEARTGLDKGGDQVRSTGDCRLGLLCRDVEVFDHHPGLD